METGLIEEKKNIINIITENQAFLYPIIFYIAGVLCGTLLYKNICGIFNLEELIKTNGTFISMLINNFCLYFSIYSVTVFLGICLIGFPIINIVPFLIGLEFSLKISYYYVNYSIKGIGYSILMLIPEAACFVTVIIYTIKMSSELSRLIYNSTTKKSDTLEEFAFKSYLKSYALYAAIVVATAVSNAGINYVLGSVVSL